MDKMLLRLVICGLLVLSPGSLSAQIEGFQESFSGVGDYQSVGGTFDGLDNPGWAMAAEGLLTEAGYEFNLVSDSETVEERIMRRVYGRGSYLQQIVVNDLSLGDRDPNFFGATSELGIQHFFTVGDLNSRVILSIADPDEEDVWRLVLAVTGPTFRREVAFVPKGAEHASLSLRYDQELSSIMGLYDANLLDDEPPIMLMLPIELELSPESEIRLNIATSYLHVSGVLNSWSLSPISHVTGDFDGDGTLDAADIDQLSAQVRAGGNDVFYDLNADAVVNDLDRQVWVHDLKQVYFGDADLNGTFDSTDLVQVLAFGEYEDDVALNSTWLTGDFDGNGDFTSGDLIVALADGGYEAGPRAAVPEPSGILLVLWGVTVMAFRRAPGCRS